MTTVRRFAFVWLAFLVIGAAGCSESQEAETKSTNSGGMQMAPMTNPISLSVEDMTVSMTLEPGLQLPVGPGQPAPPLYIESFVHGDALTDRKDGTVYVIEFWATWCGSCLQSFSLLSDLKQQHGDAIEVVAITSEEEDVVKTFLNREIADGDGVTWGDQINFTLAIDNDDRTHRKWRELSQDEGLPYAIVVGKKGLIEWMGHAASLEQPLNQILEGTWDYSGARDRMISDVEGQQAIDQRQQAILTAVNAGNYKEALQVTKGILKKLPDNPKVLALQRQLALEGDLFYQLNEILAAQAKIYHNNPAELNRLAWEIAVDMQFEKRDLDLALEAAKRASELTQHANSSVLDTVARVYFEKGELDEAIAWQQKAVEVDPDVEYFREVLQGYQETASEE